MGKCKNEQGSIENEGVGQIRAAWNCNAVFPGDPV